MERDGRDRSCDVLKSTVAMAGVGRDPFAAGRVEAVAGDDPAGQHRPDHPHRNSAGCFRRPLEPGDGQAGSDRGLPEGFGEA